MDDVGVFPETAGGVYECELWIYSGDSVRMASLEVIAVENPRPSNNRHNYIAVLGSTNPETCSQLCLPQPLSRFL